MKTLKLNLRLFSAIAFLALAVASCKKEDDKSFGFSELKADGIDLNGASTATGVPKTATITAKFTTDVNGTTATAANIKLKNTFDNSDVPLNISAAGNTVTIDPVNDLGDGNTYELTISSGLVGTNGTAFTNTTRSFKTGGTFAPAGIVANWTFEDNANDVVGTFDPAPAAIIGISYEASRNAAAGKAAVFNGDNSIIEIPNGDDLMDHSFTLAFWVKTMSAGHVNENGDPAGHFVMGLGAFKGFQVEIQGDYSAIKMAGQYELADGTTTGEDLWFNGSGEDKDNGGWQGWDFVKDLKGSGGVASLVKDKWAHVVMMYDAPSKRGTMYINGELMKSQDFDLWPVGDPKTGVVGMKYGGVAPEVVNEFAFGFVQSRAGTLWDTETWGGYDFPTANHFKGSLDDVKIWHKSLTAAEVTAMYNSEK